MKKKSAPVSFVSPEINHKEVGLFIKKSLKKNFTND